MDEQSQRVFDALFRPRSIALVGASGDPSKNTSRPQRMLHEHGFAGSILPVNPARSEVLGIPSYPSLREAPGPIDHAFVMVPVKAVPDVIDQCVERKVAVATIYTDGFAEAGPEGRRLQNEIVGRARDGGVRVLGPNCSGVYSTSPSVALSVNSAIERLDVTPGRIAIVSQSGSMTGGLVSRGLGRGLGFSRIISIGNEADLSIGEITDLLVEDPQTGTIVLFIESISDAARLAGAARRAAEAGKPILAYKLGRSEVGRDLAASHTGSMVGSDDVADAFFRAHGILRVDNLEALFELPALLADQRPAARHRVAVMSTTGGGAAIVVDRLGTVGLEVVGPSDAVVEKLAEQGIEISKARLTDLTHAGTRPEVYGPVLSELLGSDHCDLVLAVAGSSAQFQPEIAVEPAIRAQRHGKPLAMFIAPHAVESLQRLDGSGVAGFRTPESCVDAIRAWSQWREPATAPLADPETLGAVEQRLSDAEGTLNEQESSAVFGKLGIPFARTEVIRGADDTVALTYPVVAKVLSPDITHKSDVGGVVLGIGSEEHLRQASASILDGVARSRPDATIDGILVQEMESGLAEVILGFRRDPQVGPVVVLGVGGVLAEVYHDFAVRIAPLDAEEARSMIAEVRGLAIIRGFRGLPEGDADALADAVVAMSQLAAVRGADILDAEINPLLVRRRGEGVIGVDGLVVLAPARPAKEGSQATSAGRSDVVPTNVNSQESTGTSARLEEIGATGDA